jgi:hypothetical protein
VISVPFIGTGNDQRGIQNLQGLFYLIVVETIFTFGYSVFNTFPQEIPTLLREIGDNLYQPGPYYLSKMIELVRAKKNLLPEYECYATCSTHAAQGLHNYGSCMGRVEIILI